MIEGISIGKVDTVRQEPTALLATVVRREPQGMILQFDGEDAPREKKYTGNQSYLFRAGQRVKVSRISGTYVVEYPVGPPDLRDSLEWEYSKGTNASINWGDVYTTVHYTSATNAGIDLRIKQPVDLTRAKELRFELTWNEMTSSSGIYIGAVKEPLSYSATKPWDDKFSALKILGESDTGRRMHSVDVSALQGKYHICIHSEAQTYFFYAVNMY